MKLFALLLIAVCHSASATDWETKDTALLGGALGLLVIDWAQTRDLTRQRETYYSTPACSDPQTRSQPLSGPCPSQSVANYRELNPLLPKHPTTDQVDKYFVLAMAGTAGLSYALPAKYRRYFLGGVVVIESVVVLHNHSIGLRVRY